MSPRTGRPTDNPKPYKITTRIDEKSKKILDEYCEQEKIPQMEAVRRGIQKLESEIKKQNVARLPIKTTFYTPTDCSI